MRRLWDVQLLLRVIIPLIIIPLLGVAPRPHKIVETFNQARFAIENDSSLAVSMALSQITEQYPWRTELWEVAGHYAFEGGDTKAAIRHFERAAKLGALSLSCQITLGDAYQQNGNLSVAITTWETILREHAPTAEVLSRLSDAHYETRDYSALIYDLKEQLDLLPSRSKSSDLYYQLGLILAAENPRESPAYLLEAAELSQKYAPSARILARAIQDALHQEDLTYTLVVSGRTLASLNEWELAAHAFERATRIRDDYAEAWAFLGEALQQLSGDPDSEDGLVELIRALELEPSSIAANTLMALYWKRHQDYDEALEYLNRAADVDPRNPVIQVDLGNAMATLGDLPTAQAYYEKAIDLAPKNPTYLRYLAEFSINHQIQVKEIALPTARKALILDPHDPASLDLMGQVFYLLEDQLSAERFFHRALQNNPEYAPAHLHLGVLYIFHNNPTRAWSQLTKALSLVPGTPTADQAQRLLDYHFSP